MMSGWGGDDYEFQRMLLQKSLAEPNDQDSVADSPDERPRVALGSRPSFSVARRNARNYGDDSDSSTGEELPRNRRPPPRKHNEWSSSGSEKSSVSNKRTGRKEPPPQQQLSNSKNTVRNRSDSFDSSSSSDDSSSKRRITSSRKGSRSPRFSKGASTDRNFSGQQKCEANYKNSPFDKESPPWSGSKSSTLMRAQLRSNSETDSDEGKRKKAPTLTTLPPRNILKILADNPDQKPKPSAACTKTHNSQINAGGKKTAAKESDDDSWDSDSDKEFVENFKREDAIAKGLPVEDATSSLCKNSNDRQLSQGSAAGEAPKLLSSQEAHGTRASKKRPADSSVSGDNSSDSERDRMHASRKRKAICNPYTLEQEEKQMSLDILYTDPVANNSLDGDRLWSDNEHPDQPRALHRRDDENRSLRQEHAAFRSPKSADKNRNSTARYRSDDIELHPTLEDPKFGPLELLPLVLQNGPDGVTHQVPAAIARYLPNYQREGIQFLYNAVINGRGAILGDDMGLGKTIQMIALLAALFEKTGTAQDKYRIERRKKLVDSRAAVRILKEQDDLMHGNLAEWQAGQRRLDYGDPELGLSPWVPVLLAVPASVVDNWQKELQVFGHFRVAVYRGKERDEALKEIKQGYAEVLLIGHSLLTSDFNLLIEISWKLAILDEFHIMKSKTSQASKCLRELTQTHPSCKLIGMSGTLQQNRHEELWNLVDIIHPNSLGTWKSFERGTVRPIKNCRSSKATPEQLELGDRTAKALGEKLKYIYIERKKDDVLTDMPEKHEKVVFCELSPLQKRMYKHLLDLPDFVLLRAAQGPCDCGINQNFFAEYKQLKSREEQAEYKRKHKYQKRCTCCYKLPVMHRNGPINEDAVLWRFQHPDDRACEMCPFCFLFACMNKLYKLSSHVALLQSDTSDFRKEGREAEREKEEAFARVAFPPDVLRQLPGGSWERGDGITDNHFELSGKMAELHKLLQKIQRENGRVLIFSYSTQTLDLIGNYLRSDGVNYSRIDGNTLSTTRQKIVDEFYKDPSITCMLLSTKAAGIGLNLTAANNVIIFDVEWNPSNDEQAQDRAYRIGQKKDVNVYRLVARGTIDEIKYLRQIYKVQLKQETLRKENKVTSIPRMFRGVEKDRDRKGELFGVENLLKFKDGSFMEEIYKATNKGSGGFTSGEVHSIAALAKTAQSLSEEKLADLLEATEDQFAKWLDDEMGNQQNGKWLNDDEKDKQQNHMENAREKHNSPKKVPNTVHNKEIDHRAFFFGKAKTSAADDDVDDSSSVEDVPGGETQMVQDICDHYELPPAESETEQQPETVEVIEEDGLADEAVDESSPMVADQAGSFVVVEAEDAEIAIPKQQKKQKDGQSLSPFTPTAMRSMDVGTPSSTTPRSANQDHQLIDVGPPPKKRLSKRNFQLIGLPMDQLRCRRATFSKFDLRLPSLSEKSED